MKRVGAASLIACALATGFAERSHASDFEFALFSGPAIPTYKQTFTLKGSSPQFQLARLTLKESPTLEAEGGLSFGASATFFLTSGFGIEARVDSVDVDLQSFGGNYSLELGPAGAPVSTTPVTLGTGETDLKRVKPVSFNLRLQSQGRVGIGLSAGVSYLSKVDLDATPTLTVSNLTASIPVSLVASPLDPEEKRHLGFNGGITLQVKVWRGLAVVGEARGFTFRRSKLTWSARETGSLTAVERALVTSLAAQLEIPDYTPGFWTARVGLAYRF